MFKIRNYLALLFATMTLCGAGHGEVITTFGTTTHSSEDLTSTSWYVRLNKPTGSPAEPFFRLNSFTVIRETSGSNSINLKLWRVNSGVATQIGAAGGISTSTSAGGSYVIDTTGFGDTAYSTAEYFVIQATLGSADGKWQSASTAISASTNTNVLASGQFANNIQGTIPYSGSTRTLDFDISASAVPEPGTLALGAFAALSGAGGYWIRRKNRKNANLESESPDLPGAVRRLEVEVLFPLLPRH